MPQNILTGKLGYVMIGAASYSFGKWNLKMKAKMVPVPNFNSAGFEQYVVGLLGGKLTVTGPYDNGNMPFVVGNQYNWILGLGPSIQLTLPAIVEEIEVAEDVENNPVVTVTAQSNGIFTAQIV